ncbi:MAG: N-acetylglucosamine-6-phosphate deacetylase [bacterium]|nr:N-acetylglucosamine-6-phosphate deacetylase [bacterium]
MNLIYDAQHVYGLSGRGAANWIAWESRQVTANGFADPTLRREDVTFNAAGKFVLPGFIDLHVHGSVGHDVMDATPEALDAMARYFAAHGVTGWLPTTLTHRHEALMAALTNVKARMAGGAPAGAKMLGARLEGPYLNREKAGAQNPGYIREPHMDEVNALLDLDVIRLLDIAPEVNGADAVIAACKRRGVVTSAAHTNATYEQVLHAHSIGLTHSTHTFNAQSPLNHRAPGTVGAVLTTDSMTAEVICDGVHVHPAAVRIAAHCKGANLALITDAIRPAGMPEGDYPFDERIVTLRDGAVRLPDGTLSGSALAMNDGVRKFRDLTGDLAWASRAASAVPARVIGLHGRKGTLDAGMDADLIVVDEDLNVYLTVVEGEIVYRQGI